ncbi:MAG: hypothetical protein FWD61_20620 [Phycisphaerales bacterium]|nr:hypothetical protein [Phycisphaerales bacterium]
MTKTLTEHAANQKRTATAILADLDLMERWRRFGRPVLVGAFAYDLMIDPDIDMEIYCPELRIEHGFQMLRECAANPCVRQARFSNELSGRDRALYWQLRYRATDGAEWKIDMWSASEDYALPRAENLIEPMRAALTPETRTAILELKSLRSTDPHLRCPSVDLYRAVLDDRVRTASDLRQWLATHKTGQLSDWRPRSLLKEEQ